ncbi:cytochrome P450 [Streptomyces buecherae]|uniref:cytochrome P450 n=1 Tax=Streptomyces buecherae TaxID=2763006 RepID=UPI0037BB26DF
MPNPTDDLHFLRDPYPTYATLRAACPVQQVPTDSGGHTSYLVTGHAEARAALADPRLSKDTAAFFADKTSRQCLHPAVAHNMLATDPPQHTRLRKLVTKAFATGAVTELRPFIAQTTQALLTRWPAGETFDFVAGLAVPLPVIVICELLGIPEEDRPTVQRWSGDLFAAGQPEIIDAASHHLADYMTNLVATKRSAPGNTLLDRLISARDDDTHLTEEELVSLAVLLFIAGHETTTNFLGNATLALLQHPTALRRLRESPKDHPAALDELLRYDAPLSLTTFRYTTEPLTLGDVAIPTGTPVRIALGAANRDPQRFPEPDLLDLGRDATAHLSFGHGIHRCLGAPLAKAEAEIALRTVLTRHPHIRLAVPPAELRWRRTRLVRGLTSLPVLA